jgi:hypothetical protein
MGNHEKYTIKIEFVCCEGMQGKVLDEVRDLQEYILKHSLDHAIGVKVRVDHSPLLEGERHGQS